MPPKVDPLTKHVERVHTVRDAGIAALPDPWIKVYERYREFIDMPTKSPMQQRLFQALTDPKFTGDIAELRSAAIAEAAEPSQWGTVNRRASAAILDALQEIYRPHAKKNFTVITERFNSMASAFTNCARVVDPEVIADQMVSASEHERTAWTQAAVHATEMDAMLKVVIAGAGLLGRDVRSDPYLLPLVVEVTGVHRRRLWAAWGARNGRCGRWAPILKCGATIRIGNLDGLSEYRYPRPMEERREERGGIVFHLAIDPEDEVEDRAKTG